MALLIAKKIDLVDKSAKNKRGICGYFKISRNNYDYYFIEAPTIKHFSMS